MKYVIALAVVLLMVFGYVFAFDSAKAVGLAIVVVWCACIIGMAMTYLYRLIAR